MTTQHRKKIKDEVDKLYDDAIRNWKKNEKKTGDLYDLSCLKIFHRIASVKSISLYDLWLYMLKERYNMHLGAHLKLSEFIPEILIKGLYIDKVENEKKYVLTKKGQEEYGRLKSKTYADPTDFLND
jgi:hypothetical protein